MRDTAERASAGSSSSRGSSRPGRDASRTLLCTALAILTALLLVAPAAQASRALIGSFGPPGEGKGQLYKSKGLAVNRTGAGGVSAGDVYVTDSGNSRIAEFSASGAFVRAFGYDVVASGPDNSGANEKQTLTVDATGGTFALKVTRATFAAYTEGSNVVTNVLAPIGAFHVGDAVSGGVPPGTTITAVGAESLTLSANATFTGSGDFAASETAASLPYNTTAAGLQAALEALPAIGAGNVAVSGGPGASAPLTIEYKGALGGDDVFHAKQETGDPVSAMTPLSEALSGATHTATLATTASGGGHEVCKASSPGDLCKAAPNCNQGSTDPAACQESRAAGSLDEPTGVAVDQATGNVYVLDVNTERSTVSANRVNVYLATGAFEGAFGWHVNATSPEEKLQFCTAATGCQKGTEGGGAGQLAARGSGSPAVNPVNGHLYVPDGGNQRVDEFAPTLNPGKEVSGASFVKAFGYDVVASGPDNVPPVNAEQLLTTRLSGGGGTPRPVRPRRAEQHRGGLHRGDLRGRPWSP